MDLAELLYRYCRYGVQRKAKALPGVARMLLCCAVLCTAIRHGLADWAAGLLGLVVVYGHTPRSPVVTEAEAMAKK